MNQYVAKMTEEQRINLATAISQIIYDIEMRGVDFDTNPEIRYLVEIRKPLFEPAGL